LAFPCYSGSSQVKHVTQGLLYESLPLHPRQLWTFIERDDVVQ
jgi:hypothetical protein